MATVEQELAPRTVSNGTIFEIGRKDGVGDASHDLRASWLVYLEREKNLAPNTLKLYGRTVEIAAQELGPLENLTDKDIRPWLHSKKGKASTTANRISALTSFYRYLVRTDERPDNPMDKIDRPKATRGLPKPIGDIAAALNALDEADIRANDRGSIPRRVGETRDMAIFLMHTGLRIHEAVACDWPTPCPATMKIHGKGRKDAIIPIDQDARDAWDRLGGQWGHGRDGAPIGVRATQRRFEQARDFAFTPHQCRHTLGSMMAAAGCDLGDIKAMLRHESMQTTLIYSAWQTSRVEAAQGMVNWSA